MTYTRLIYSTLVAASVVGGTVWYLDAPRSTLKAIDAYTLTERVMAIRAIVQGDYNYNPSAYPMWPFTNSVTTNVGWYVTTNTLTATNWSFNGYSRVPLIGSVIPRAMINETLDQLVDMVPHFVDYVQTNYTAVDFSGTVFSGAATNSHIELVRLSVTGLWARLNIGDGTNLWTVGYTTNMTPIYSNHIGSVVNTTTLYEAWRVATNLTKAEISAQLIFNYDYNVFATVSEVSPNPPHAPVYPASYSDSPADTSNDAYYYLQLNNDDWAGIYGMFIEAVKADSLDTNTAIQYARLEGTGTLHFASFPTNVTCQTTTWLEYSFPVPRGYAGDLLWSIDEARTNAPTFTGLSTGEVSFLAVPITSLGNWGDYLTGRGVTIATSTVDVLLYNVDTWTLAEWDFGD